MANKKNVSKKMSASDRKKVKEAREMQYGVDFAFYEVFARIWGWDGYKTEPEKAVQQLCRYLKAEEKKEDPPKELPKDPELQFCVGVAYLSGWIPCESKGKKAAVWFARSELQGCDKGALGLGYIREKGLAGCDPVDDYKEMVEDYTNAAKKGNVYAQYRLANILYRADPDNPRLIQLLMNADDAGYQPAKKLWEKVTAEKGKKERPKASSMQIPANFNYDELCQILLEMHRDVVETKKVAVKNQESLQRLEVSVQMLQSSLNEMWTELRESGEEFRQELEKLRLEMENHLNRISPKELEEAEKFMQVLFKGDWRKPSRLCEESCDALVAAYVLMKAAGKLKIKNYAGIIISATWALEHECRRRFFHRYIRYLKEQHLEIPDVMYGTRKRKRVLEFTLGKVYPITQTEAFEEFAQTYLMSESAKEAVPVISRIEQKPEKASLVFTNYVIPNGDKTAFTITLMEILDMYRNKAAHADVVNRAKAVTCCNVLGITEVHKEMDNLAGALKALLWLTAPLE